LPVTITLETGIPEIVISETKISETENTVTYKFSASNQKPLTGGITEYLWWNFDQHPVTDAEPIVTFEKGTCYYDKWAYIKLSGKIENGEGFYTDKSFEIANAKIDITANPYKTSGIAPCSVDFNYVISSCTSIDDYEWDFGLGVVKTFNTGEIVSNLYRYPGKYNVKVRPKINLQLQYSNSTEWKEVGTITVKPNIIPILNMLLD
jgi:hypothetical protein